MIQINSEFLKPFDKEGLSINEGIAVDARLVKSASRPLSNDDIKKYRNKRNSPEGKLDKNGNPLSIIETWSQIGLLKMMSLITVLKSMHPAM